MDAAAGLTGVFMQPVEVYRDVAKVSVCNETDLPIVATLDQVGTSGKA
tara:strand:+ start:1361 stop:1504 length:144 start_codon:yes stop_codon:yes gene_type:complete